MAIYQNGSKIKSVMRGATAIRRIYHGAGLVYQGEVSSPPAVLAPPPSGADYVSVYDVTNGWSLYEKASDTAGKAGSLVKMATAVLLMRRKAGSLTATATVTAADMANTAIAETHAGLTAGDVISYEDLLYGLLLPSGGDAARCIARTIGDEMFAETGSGTSGVPRFVEALNALALELGLTGATFFSPHGANAGDLISARAATVLAREAFTNSVLRTIAGTKSRVLTITGANARTYTVTHSNQMVDDANVLAAKTGTDTSDGAGNTHCNLSVLWQAPNGSLIVATVISAPATNDRYLDMRGILYKIVADFPYLDDGATEADPQFANVVFLAGADAGFVDESSYARSLTASGATRTTAALIGAHSFSFDGVDDRIEAADADELSFASGDMAVEFWYAGNGAEPSDLVAFVSKYDSSTNQREWSVQYDRVTKQIVFFASSNGTAFVSAVFAFDGISPGVFFNGAPRHILARRSGTEIAVYVNGVKGTPATAAAFFSGPAKMMLGARQNGAGILYPLRGKLDEIRITKGNSRQTAAKFTPKPKAFPRTG